MLSILNHATFFCVGRFALAVFYPHYLLPHVGNIGTISKTLNGIGLSNAIELYHYYRWLEVRTHALCRLVSA